MSTHGDDIYHESFYGSGDEMIHEMDTSENDEGTVEDTEPEAGLSGLGSPGPVAKEANPLAMNQNDLASPETTPAPVVPRGNQASRQDRHENVTASPNEANPGSSTHQGSHARSGLSASPGSPGEPMRLSSLQAEELCSYLKRCGLVEAAIENVRAMDITGSQWASMVNDTAEQSFETIEELWNEIGIIPRIMRSRLLTDARASVHAEGRFEELELISESERKTRAMAERLEFLTGEKSKSGKSKEFADETSDKSSTIKARIHFSPKIPAESVVENNEGIIDAIEALQLFGIGMSTWMEAHDPALAKAITEVMDRVTEAQMEGLIEKFSPATKKIDIELGGHLYSSSPNECQLELHDAPWIGCCPS